MERTPATQTFPPVAEQLAAIRDGVLEIVGEDDLARKLERAARTGRPLVVKQGFDPTRPDLHLGHAVSLRKLRTFQELGHEVVFVVGDLTARVGDPTGRSEQRPPLSAAEVAANARTYTEQAFRILDPTRTRVEFNSRWLEPLRLPDILELTAKYTVARLLEREDFAQRYREGRPIAVVEFLYPLLQAYDSVALRADVEVGGADQRFNLLVGRDVQERYGQEPQVCVLLPLLRGTDGVRKMSKTFDNAVGLTEPPEEQYGKTMSIPDAVLDEWIELASGWPPAERARWREVARRDPYAAKRALAWQIVAQFHGPAAADRAAAHFDRVHRERAVPEAVPEVVVPAAELVDADGRVWLPRLLVRAGLAGSTSEAGRLLEEGAIAVDEERVTDRATRLPAPGTYLLRRGKRRFARVRLV